jgi:hypothetical protein
MGGAGASAWCEKCVSHERERGMKRKPTAHAAICDKGLP